MTYAILKSTSADNFTEEKEIHRDFCENRIAVVLRGLEQLAALCGDKVRYAVAHYLD